MISLFVVSTFEGWRDFFAINSNEEDRGPVYNARQGTAIFFISFIVVISFFMMNIFVGFVIATFRNEDERDYKNCELDKIQRKCIEFALKAKPHRRYIARNRCQYKIWQFVTSQFFEYGIFIIILLNATTLAMKHYSSDPEMDSIFDILNLVFTGVFFFEALLKIFALNPKNYFGDRWNSFDFAIVSRTRNESGIRSEDVAKFRQLNFQRTLDSDNLFEDPSKKSNVKTPDFGLKEEKIKPGLFWTCK
uniref:Ion transport domain-containing protein n=1 Tax=Panagrolaimus davidi TaxID=227884 RepID=A0A914PJG5_9BILA